MYFYLFFGLIFAVAVFFFFLSRRNEREAVRSVPLTEDEWAIIRSHVPIIDRLPNKMLNQFEYKVQRFRQQITFYGAEELDVTDEMELTISALACLMIVNVDVWYQRLQTIIIYPSAYKLKVREFDGVVMHEYETARLGESWAGGPVVLSWQHSTNGALDPDDGHNLVLHEFAHQLDDLTGSTNALPPLADQSESQWRSVFEDAYNRHVFNIRQGKRSALDAYGATSMVEYFAVAVELFFEKPDALIRQEKAVYDQLSEFFQLDPAAWA